MLVDPIIRVFTIVQQQAVDVDPSFMDLIGAHQQTVFTGVLPIAHESPFDIQVGTAEVIPIIAAVGMLVSVESRLEIR